MKSGFALAALAFGGMSLAQSSSVVASSAVEVDGVATTLVSNIDPSDIAALPEPAVLGPPIGVVDSVTSATYNAAEATASVLALVVAATDAQTAVIAPESTAISPSETPVAEKRSYVGGLSGNLRRRDLSYPVDTSKFGVPSGYTPAFVSYQGATQANGYLTYKTLSTYDPKQCTAACDKISSCQFANIYYEKDPDSKNNPVDVIKCSLYSMPQTNATATNKGQWRGSFHVLVTGSNGYNKAAAPKTPAGYSLGSLPGAVNAPVYDSVGQWRFIQPVYLTSYDPALCAAACDQQTAYDKSQASDDCNYKTCTYANMYILSKNGVPKTVVCALYTEVTDSSYATNYGYSTDTDSYQVSNSIALTNSTAVKAGYPQLCAALPGDISYLNKTGSDFCTSYLGYVAPTETAQITITPGATTVFATVTEEVTITSVYSTETVQVTGAPQNERRQESKNIITTTVELPYITVSKNKTIIEYKTSVLTVDAASTKGAKITPASVDPAASIAAHAKRNMAKRSAIPTPSSVVGWPSAKLSSACSEVATGTVTVTQTATASGSVVTAPGATQSVTQVTSIVSTITVTVSGGAAASSTASETAAPTAPACPKTVGTQGQLSLGGYSLGFPTPITFDHDPLFWTPLGGFGDEFIYDTTGNFLYHVDTGYCLALGDATATTTPMYLGSPFTLEECSCSTSTTVTQSFTFRAVQVGSGADQTTKNCILAQGDYPSTEGPYFPKLVDTGDDTYPFSAVYADNAFDACITFEADS